MTVKREELWLLNCEISNTTSEQFIGIYKSTDPAKYP